MRTYRDRLVEANQHLRLMPTPTDAEPGSAEKVETLRGRWSKRQAMHHPEDMTNWQLRDADYARLVRTFNAELARRYATRE